MPSLSKREQVLNAVTALLAAANPDAVTERNRAFPAVASDHGDQIVNDGDPGEPIEVCLSPLLYTYEHRIPVDILSPEGADDRSAALDAMLTNLAPLIEASRTLDGLVTWLDAEAPAPEDLPGDDEPLRFVTLTVIATYDTTSPLT